ncbi:MAG: leucine-rich repeat protein [Bacteroidaceae bacterium]|nr:leucine-rich repeat protein [Bacteroidaceae bacterium]
MKTRIFIGLAVMLMTLFGITAYANENNDNPTAEANIDGLNYFLDFTTHEATITTDHTVSGELNIPSEINYKGETFVVKGMAWCSFYNNQKLTKVMIPKTVEGILNYVPHDPEDGTGGAVAPIYLNPFEGCTALESIEVDEENPSFKSVDGVLFSQDGVGQYYYHTNNYKGTGLYCYPEGKQQNAYTIPDGVEWIGGDAVSNNKYLTTLTIPNSMKHICTSAFEGCSNLKDLYCKADNVPVVWESVFKNVLIASATLHVPAGSIEKYKTTSPWKDFGNIVPITANVQHSGCLRETRDDAEEYKRAIILTKEGSVLTVQLLNYESNCGTTDFDVTHAMSWSSTGIPYSIYVTVKPICENEEDCICPYNVTFTIENVTDNSFRFVCWWYDGLVNLTDGKSLVLKEDVNINVEGLIYNLDDESFTAKLINGKTWEGELSIPSEIEWKGQKYVVNSIGQKAFEDCKGLTSISIPKSITTIGSNAFYGCTGLSTITIPDDITIIESGLFKDCVNLTSVIIPEGITTIGGDSFFGCKSLASIMIPESVTSIGNNAFARCTSLTSFIIPNGVTSISQCTFSGCTNLTFVTIPNGVTSIGWAAFKECYSLTNISIPDGVTTIGDMAFANSALTTIIIPNSVQSMGKSVFFSCKHLTSVVLSENLTSINEETFEDCISLTNINIPNGVTTIGYGAFYTCRNLPKITIPNSVTNIGSSAFSGCLGLLTLSIGKNVTHIGMSAFQNCTNLTDVYCYTDSVPIIENVAFTFNKRKPIASATLHVPVNSVDLYKADSRWNGFGNIVALEEETVSYTKDQMATIILPIMPDASKGKYYGLDRCEEGKIIFTEEREPKARTPYIIVPNEDFSIDLDKLELESLLSDTVSVKGAMFIGSYSSAEMNCQEGFYIDIIDATPDSQIIGTDQRKAAVGALRAYLVAPWDDPYAQGGSRGVTVKREIVLKDNPNGIESLIPNPSLREGSIYDLQGRRLSGKPSRGIYIKDHRKVAIK